MCNLQNWMELMETRMETHPVDPLNRMGCETDNYICVLTIPNPKDASKQISNVMCQYRLAGNQISFQKNPFDSDESFEDALNWAKDFAFRQGIATVYAANFAEDT